MVVVVNGHLWMYLAPHPRFIKAFVNCHVLIRRTLIHTASMSLPLLILTVMASSTGMPGDAAYADAPVEFSQLEQEWIDDHPVIVMGYNPDWAPYEYLDDDGKLSGVTPDLAKRFSEISGLKFVPATSIESWDDNLESIRNGGDVDVVFTSWETRSPNRDSYMDFTSSWYDIPADIITHKSNLDMINEQNWHQYRVVIVEGFEVEPWVVENMPDLNYLPAESYLDAIEIIADGDADVYLDPWDIVNHVATKHGITGLVNVGQSDAAYGLVLGYAEGNDTFGSILQKMIDDLEDEVPQIVSDAVDRSNATLAPFACR